MEFKGDYVLDQLGVEKLPEFDEVEGDFIIAECKFVTFTILPLTTIKGNLYIGYNDYLTSIEGLSNLTFVGGNVIIYENSSLNGLIGLCNLEMIMGDLYIINNPAIHNLRDLKALNFIGRDLRAIGNSNMIDYTLQNSPSVGGRCEFNNVTISEKELSLFLDI